MMEAGSSTTSKENGKAKGKGKSSRCSSSSSSSSTRSWGWTNERHLRFLNTIEASFVQAMFENINYNSNSNNNNDNKKKNNICDDIRLDRHIPDSYESTQDLPMAKLRRPRTFSTSPSPDVEDRSVRVSKKNKGQLSNDQVVPQVEIRRRDNENDKDGKNVD